MRATRSSTTLTAKKKKENKTPGNKSAPSPPFLPPQWWTAMRRVRMRSPAVSYASARHSGVQHRTAPVPASTGERRGARDQTHTVSSRVFGVAPPPSLHIPTFCVCVCPIWPFAEYCNRRKWLMEGSPRGSASHLRGSCVGAALPRLPWRRFATIWIRVWHFNARSRWSTCTSSFVSLPLGVLRPVLRPHASCRSCLQQVPGEHRLPPAPPPPNLLTTQPVFFFSSNCLIKMWLRVKPPRWMDWLIDWLKVEYVESFTSHVLLLSVCFLSELGSFVEDRLEVIHRAHTSLPTVEKKKSGHRRWAASQPPTRWGHQPLHCSPD